MRLVSVQACWLFLAAGCSAGIGGGAGDDDGDGEPADASPGAPDADPLAPDADPDAPDAAPGIADAAAEPPEPDAATPIVGLPYPARDAYHIKGIMTDFWPDRGELVSHQIGAISVNLVWAQWEPSVDPAPCSGSQQEYAGRCFAVDAQADAEIAAYTGLGVAVTAIVYGVPAWARTGNTGCSPQEPWMEIFCAPDSSADYARFAGMLARRYDGLHGHGRIADFVIHNEVNTNVWYDIGCGQGVPCDQNQWIQRYASDYNAAYDAIKAHQSEAKVLVSFDLHFGEEFDQPGASFSMIGAKSFMTQLAPKLGARRWQIAYHPYPADLFRTEFGPLDLPALTYGNLGVLLAWLRAAFPDRPHAWEVQLTESGFNSASPSTEAAQAEATCRGLRNILGTPGITSYIYHRMQDHAADGAWRVGLRRADKSAKPAWAVWANANRVDLSPPQLDCGFEELPYTRLTSSAKGSLVKVHWTSSRLPPGGYAAEQSWRLLRDGAAGTRLLYECHEETLAGDTTFLTADVGCEGQQNLGPVGYAYTSQVAGSVPLYRCEGSLGLDSYVSQSAQCDGGTSLGLLGYALPAP